MTLFRFLAEASTGAVIHEADIEAATHKEAYRTFWQGMTDAQRDACACIECLDEVPA